MYVFYSFEDIIIALTFVYQSPSGSCVHIFSVFVYQTFQHTRFARLLFLNPVLLASYGAHQLRDGSQGKQNTPFLRVLEEIRYLLVYNTISPHATISSSSSSMHYVFYTRVDETNQARARASLKSKRNEGATCVTIMLMLILLSP